MTKDDALKLALGALESIAWHDGGWGLNPDLIETAITAIKEASAQPAQDRTDYAVHLNHCNIGECQGVCKYLDDDCPALKHADMKAKWDSPATQQPAQEPVATLFGTLPVYDNTPPQPAQEPPQYSFKAYWAEDGRIGVIVCIIRPDGGPHILEEFIDPPQPAQEPVAYLCKPDQHGLFNPPTPDKACKDCFPVYAAPPQLAQEPVCPACKAEVLYECVACSNNNYPPQPAQEPVAWMNKDGWIGLYKQGDANIPLYTAPPQRPWVGLTDKDKTEILNTTERDERGFVMELVEAKLKDKNNAA